MTKSEKGNSEIGKREIAFLLWKTVEVIPAKICTTCIIQGTKQYC